MKGVAGLLTCGDADRQRMVINNRFRAAYRNLGVNILWKSFPNHPHDVPQGSTYLAQEFLPHDVPQGSTYLAQEFLEFYHKLYANDLDKSVPKPRENLKPLLGEALALAKDPELYLASG